MTQNSTEIQAIHILIVDDHQLLLNGTVEIVKDLYPTGIIRTAQTAQAAIERATEQPFDLAIVDLSLPESPGSNAQVETGLTQRVTLEDSHIECWLDGQRTLPISLAQPRHSKMHPYADHRAKCLKRDELMPE